eukprot:scaffold114734_cov33-Tisochrysis_lutea.AAC.1
MIGPTTPNSPPKQKRPVLFRSPPRISVYDPKVNSTVFLPPTCNLRVRRVDGSTTASFQGIVVCCEMCLGSTDSHSSLVLRPSVGAALGPPSAPPLLRQATHWAPLGNVYQLRRPHIP